jgi:hypothetical protein
MAARREKGQEKEHLPAKKGIPRRARREESVGQRDP